MRDDILSAVSQRVIVHKINMEQNSLLSEEQIFLMRIDNGEIKLKSNEEVLTNLKKALKLDDEV